ncbi:hypothetical protein [Bdellovibrio sp. NC01]|uniref:hypothetical protein n=1 Tax=Bdellovibrio sp. NC01 TaxID=2220073 RepID=UPI00115BDB1A|nr:hypothetical protein [Bdellovibrio sp. NC01]
MSACSLDADIASLEKALSTSFSKPTTAEVTPASTQNSYTTRGYKVQASLSYQNTNSDGTTTRGFKVNTNVQGSIFKE